MFRMDPRGGVERTQTVTEATGDQGPPGASALFLSIFIFPDTYFLNVSLEFWEYSLK